MRLTEDDIRDLIRARAEKVPQVPARLPNEVLRRAKRRFVRTAALVGGTLLVVGVGAFYGLGAVRPVHPVPYSVSHDADGAAQKGGGGSSPERLADGTIIVSRRVTDGDIAFTVGQAKCGSSDIVMKKPRRDIKSQGQFCTVTLRVRNVGEKSQRIDWKAQYLLAGTGTFASDLETTRLLNAGTGFLSKYSPRGSPIDGLLVFDIPEDVRPDGLELHESSSSTGAIVPLVGATHVYFPVQQPMNVVMQAQLAGRLVRRGPCLYVLSDEGGLKLPIWPDGFSYRDTADEMFVLDAQGRTVAQVGSPITMGGGETPRRQIRGLTGMDPDEAPCHGPYWLVGEMTPRP